jgi:sulfate transport system ATP-binding protein
VRLGPVHFPLKTAAGMSGARRVQVLFRPEDVALAPSLQTLADPALGEAEVEQVTFVGSFERLRLRLPSIQGVKPIAPAVPFGSDSILVEATRSQDQARQFPLSLGDRAWIGVRRIHALTHPGLRLLIASGESPAAQAALNLGGQIARLAHARTTILSTGLRGDVLERHLQAVKEQLGSGLPALETRGSTEPAGQAVAREVERQPYDLVVVGVEPQRGVEMAEEHLQEGEHHLLLVPRAQSAPSHVLICVASGEPGKEDVLFAGRLARHLGAEVTLLSVIPQADDLPDRRQRTERFLIAGVRTLALLGVPARTTIRVGAVRQEIMDEMETGGHDLLVLGAPLSQRDGRAVLAGVVGQIVSSATNYPVLIVRSRWATGVAPWIAANGRVNVRGEIIR